MSNRYFVAQYFNSAGEKIKRTFFLPTISDVRREIALAEGTVLAIQEKRKSWLNREYYTNDYRITFLNGLSFYVDVGGSPAAGLMHMITGERNPSRRAEMQDALNILSSGGQFGDALAALPFVDKTLVTILQTADSTGAMHDAIKDAIGVLEGRRATLKLLAAALGWLGFDLFTIISSVFTMQFYAIPWFRKNPPSLTNEQMAAEYASRFEMIAGATTTITAGTTLLGLAICAVFLVVVWGGENVKARIYDWLTSLPLFRKVFIDGTLGSELLLLSRMTKTGVPITQGLALLKEFSRIPPVRRFWGNIQLALDSGYDLTHAFDQGGVLQRRELEAISAHQNREQLANVLTVLGKRRSEDAESGIKQFARISVIVSVLYMFLVVGLAVWMLTLQNFGLEGAFGDLMQGGF